MRLFDTNRFEMGFMVEPAGGVVVARRIAGRDLEW